jgi:PLP dependent protein
MSVAANLNSFKKNLPSTVELVAVSKTKPPALIEEAYAAGQRHFGENKIQEMTAKWEVLPKDIAWHMIGHVQTNKVKYMAPYVHLIHGVDSEKLLKEINKQGLKNNRCIDCLLQVFIANETTKFGLAFEAVLPLIEKSCSMDNVRVVGLMGMASFSENPHQVGAEFGALKKLFLDAKKHFSQVKILSMGMSGDYQIAIEQESNMIRIGSKIFGSRH